MTKWNISVEDKQLLNRKMLLKAFYVAKTYDESVYSSGGTLSIEKRELNLITFSCLFFSYVFVIAAVILGLVPLIW